MEDFVVGTADIQLRRELVDAGLTDRDIVKLVRAGTLTKVRYGAYVRTELVKDLDAVGLMRARSRAVLREQICLATGWICLRITWSDIERPLVLARRIRKALASRTRHAS